MQRYAHERVEFEGGGFPSGATLPADLFETATENLLQNALEKRKAENKLHITAKLQWDDGFHLSVCDDGQPVPVALVRQLFAAPVQSNTGLGVGLYQVARFARDQGYEVTLTSNQEAKVCITLAPSRRPAAAA